LAAWYWAIGLTHDKYILSWDMAQFFSLIFDVFLGNAALIFIEL
jgi:hypothetical protein